MFRITTTYSPDDYGWFAEVWSQTVGRTVYTTDFYPTRDMARKDADRWIDRKEGIGP